MRILLNLTVLKSGRIKETFSLNGDTTFQVRIQKDSMQRRGKILALFRTDEKVYTVSDIEAGKVYDIPSECVGKEFSVSIVNDYPGGTSSTGFLLVRTVSSGLSSDDTDTIKQAVTDWLNANPGAVTSLSEEQKNKLKAILLDGDGSSVLSDNGSYIDFAEKVREVIDGNTVDIKDEKVKLTSSSTDAQYLENLIDNATIEVDTANNCLVVRKIDGQTVTVAEINFLTGVKSNVQEQINNLGKAMTMYGVFGTKAELLAAITPVPVDGNTAIVIADEDNDNKQMTYIYIASNSAWTQVAESSVNVRDFSTNPIDLSSETTGTLPKAKIDAAIARLADVLDIATYKGTGNGIVKQADKLTGLTATIAALNQAVSDAHTHANKAVLDKIVSNGIGSGFLANNGEYIEILHIGNTSPTYDSQIWIDNTDSSNIVLKIYDGSKWIAVSGGGSGQSVDLSSYYTKTETDTLLTSKVDAVAGLGLSKESYTTEEKNKLKGLENYDDTAIAGRVTAIEGDYANKTYVGEQIANIDKLTRKIVTSLPSDADADETVIYMLKVTSTNGDEYELYMKIEGTVKLIGNTTIDLSGYAKTTDVNVSLDAKVDKVSGKGLSTNDITDTLKAGYDDAVAKAHEHANSNILDKFGEDGSGMPLYDGDKFYDGLIANNLTTTTTGYALDATQGKALNDKFGKVLWTNTNPVAFDTMTITLSSSDYDVLDIYWLWNTTSNNMYVTSCLKGYCSSIKGYSVVNAGTDTAIASVLIREVTKNSDTSFTVNSILTTHSGYNSNYLIPVKVIGRKIS